MRLEMVSANSLIEKAGNEILRVRKGLNSTNGFFQCQLMAANGASVQTGMRH